MHTQYCSWKYGRGLAEGSGAPGGQSPGGWRDDGPVWEELEPHGAEGHERLPRVHRHRPARSLSIAPSMNSTCACSPACAAAAFTWSTTLAVETLIASLPGVQGASTP